jgi:gluconokinase
MLAMILVERQRAEPPLVLAVDIGTSSTRSLLFDRQGRQVAGSLARVATQPRITPDGGYEDDADQVLDHVARSIDATLGACRTLADQVGAVALATYVSNVLGVDAHGQPLTPIYLYADTRDSADAARLRAELDERDVLDRTGCPLRTSYLPARLRWLQRTQPATVARVWRWLTVGEYVQLHWLGSTRVSLSAASWSGLLNRHTLDWDATLLETLDLDAATLSPLTDTDAPQHGLRPPYAARWPTLAQVPWFAAVGDGAAANIGSGCVEPSAMALTIGTSGALRMVTPTVSRVPWGLWCYRVDRRRALLGGATSEGGNVFGWLTQLLQVADQRTLEETLDAYEPDSHGLTILPFVAGERSPGWAGDLRASIVGLRLDTSSIDILRAALEATAYRFALIADLLDQTIGGVKTCVANGGALHTSPAWTRIFADVLGRPVYASDEQEQSSRGAALLALEALGHLPDLASLSISFSHVYKPDMARHARYRAAIERQQQLYRVLANPATGAG